jgi:hypothetical protein
MLSIAVASNVRGFLDMHPHALGRVRVRFVIVLAALCGAWLASAGAAQASCVFDPVLKTATIQTLEAGTLRVSGTEIWFGSPPAPCGGATTTNTDLILFRQAGTLTVDLNGGMFAPGATSESGVSEIEIAAHAVSGEVIVLGTPAADAFVGANWDLTGDGDGDMSLAVDEFRLGGGDDVVSAFGGGLGTATTPTTYLGGEGNDTLRAGSGSDVLDGGPGNDSLEGRDGDDELIGGPGNDYLSGGNDDDRVTGGEGVDDLRGNNDDDHLVACDDATRDKAIVGANGVDSGCGTSVDPNPNSVESYTVGPLPPPPPPPDTTPPSAPAGPMAVTTTRTTIDLDWGDATDNVGVAGYKVYRSSGSVLTTVPTTQASITGLQCGTAYSYEVAAFDAAGNHGARLSTGSISTDACPPNVATVIVDNVVGWGGILGSGIECGDDYGDDCRVELPADTDVELRASPGADFRLAG